MKINQLDNFESLIKDALDKQSAPYNSSDWDDLNNRLNKTNKPFYKSPWIIAASLLAVVGTVYLTTLTPDSEKTDISKQEQQIETPDFVLEEETSFDTISQEKENAEIREVFISAEKEIIKTEKEVSANKDVQNNNINSETKISDNIEVESNNQNNENNSEENGLTPLDSDDHIEETSGNEIVISVKKAAFHMNTFECCEGTTIDFVAEKQNEVEYLWSFDDGNYSKDENPSHQFEKAGSYKISLIVQSRIDNSIMSKSNDQLLIVHAKPKVDFDWEMNEENGIPYTSLINLTDKAISWSWNFGDGSVSTKKDPNHTYRNKGQYLISLSGTSEEGCVSKVNKDIFIDQDYNLLAPNSFTPNGDGLNDYFLPKALNRLNGTFSMTVYSQTEGLIYETTNIDRPWDGTNQKMGSKCKEGSYVWVVNLKNEKGIIEQYKGAVLLLK